MCRWIPRALVAACALLPARASAQSSSSTAVAPADAPADGSVAPARRPARSDGWGEGSISFLQRSELLSIQGAEVGSSGEARGTGVELRFVMPIGWGAYYRYFDVATAAPNRPIDEQFEWQHREFTAGMSRRLLRVGGGDLWALRAQASFDLGFGWAQVGTHQQCTRGYLQLGTSCSTGPGRPGNVQGDALSLEARLAAQVSLGPLAVGADLGIAGYLTIVGGPNSVVPPWAFFAPSGQLRLGLALPY